MDINNLDITDKELICDAIKVALSQDAIKVNDRFWKMEDVMEEVAQEIRDGLKPGCQEETWGLVCDALEVVISPEVIKVNNRFKNQKQYLEQMVKQIEEQSGCMTHED